MKPLLVVDRVSKKYSMRPQSNKRHSLADFGRELVGASRAAKLREGEFWAVRDISFTMFPGESMALVGRNGSGKSTLLKMLNGLIPLDEGTVSITPDTQALINLGAGFHPNLTGRDNIYSSAALLGLKKRETDAIVEKVIDFSELGDFIDSPVATYSSGMYARLGFSVAIHLRPRLMLVDEILSVGDYSFRNKCLEHMQQLRKSGVGIILVSHNQTQILQFCTKAIWLEKGSMRSYGDAKSVVQDYMLFMDKLSTPTAAGDAVQAADNGPSLFGNILENPEHVRDVRVVMLSRDRETNIVKINDPLEIRYEFQLDKQARDLNISVVVYDEEGVMMTGVSSLNGHEIETCDPGTVRGRLTIRDMNLAPGKYTVVLPVHEGPGHLYRDVVGQFIVVRRQDMTWGKVTFDYEYEITTPDGKTSAYTSTS